MSSVGLMVSARNIVVGFAAAMILFMAAKEASARPGSPVCRQLEASLASLGAPSGGSRFSDAVVRQSAEIQRMSAYMQQQRCGQAGAAANCGALAGQLRQMQVNLGQLEQNARREGGQAAGRGQDRARIIAQLQINNCRGDDTRIAGRPQAPQAAVAAPSRSVMEPVMEEGPERQIFMRARSPEPSQRPQTAYRAPTAVAAATPRAEPNFIERLFGIGRAVPAQGQFSVEVIPDDTPTIVIPEDAVRQQANVGHRTVCVRLCDGAFFPLTSSARPGADVGQDELCRLQCPGAEVEVFRMTTTEIENAVSANSGRGYSSLPNALRFRREFVQGCACRPPGMQWNEAVSRTSDPTLRPGDTVVTAEQARIMSLPEVHRRQAREEQAAADRARRDVERQARGDRGARRDGAPQATVGLDGTARAAPEPEPPAMRGSATPEVAEEAIVDPPRPVRLIGPVPRSFQTPPRAETPLVPRG